MTMSNHGKRYRKNCANPFQNVNIGTETKPPGPRRPMFTMRSESANGSGRRITAFTTVKMAVLEAMPIAGTATAVEVKPGLLRRVRTENFKLLMESALYNPTAGKRVSAALSAHGGQPM